jgi:hypothetical protein
MEPVVSDPDDSSSVEIEDSDVLLGRGKSNMKHPGNARFHGTMDGQVTLFMTGAVSHSLPVYFVTSSPSIHHSQISSIATAQYTRPPPPIEKRKRLQNVCGSKLAEDFFA